MTAEGLGNQRILVTGGAGFIGSRVVAAIVAAGGTAGVLDNLSVGLPMPAATPAIVSANVDIRDDTATMRFFETFAADVVIHLAAVHHIPTCERRRAYALDVNVVGTENVFAACEASRVPHVVVASTGAVYAWSEERLDEEHSPLGASDNYSVGKLANETQARLWSERCGGRVRIARIFNTIGSGDPNAHLIPDVMDQIPQGATSATLKLGNLAPRRDYIYVEDTAAGLLALAGDKRDPQVDIFNICSGIETPVETLVRTIGRQLGATLTIEQDLSRVRRIDRVSQVGSPRKAAVRLGWSVTRDLDASVAAIIASTGGARGAT